MSLRTVEVVTNLKGSPDRLTAYTPEVLPTAAWALARENDVTVAFEQADMHAWRYPDLTEQAHYLSEVLRQTVEQDMAQEALAAITAQKGGAS